MPLIFNILQLDCTLAIGYLIKFQMCCEDGALQKFQFLYSYSTGTICNAEIGTLFSMELYLLNCWNITQFFKLCICAHMSICNMFSYRNVLCDEDIWPLLNSASFIYALCHYVIRNTGEKLNHNSYSTTSESGNLFPFNKVSTG